MTRRLGFLMLAGLLLAGCREPVLPARQSTTAQAPVTVSSPPPTTTSVKKWLSKDEEKRLAQVACEQPQANVYNATSQPYTGPGPHFVDTFQLPIAGKNVQYKETPKPAGLIPAGDPLDRDRVKLLVCIQPVLGKRSGTAYCFFDRQREGRHWPLYETTYQLTIREARSGREIKVLTLQGTETPEASCPELATDYPDAKVARSLTAKVLDEALRPIVDL